MRLLRAEPAQARPAAGDLGHVPAARRAPRPHLPRRDREHAADRGSAGGARRARRGDVPRGIHRDPRHRHRHRRAAGGDLRRRGRRLRVDLGHAQGGGRAWREPDRVHGPRLRRRRGVRAARDAGRVRRRRGVRRHRRRRSSTSRCPGWATPTRWATSPDVRAGEPRPLDGRGAGVRDRDDRAQPARRDRGRDRRVLRRGHRGHVPARRHQVVPVLRGVGRHGSGGGVVVSGTAAAGRSGASTATASRRRGWLIGAPSSRRCWTEVRHGWCAALGRSARPGRRPARGGRAAEARRPPRSSAAQARRAMGASPPVRRRRSRARARSRGRAGRPRRGSWGGRRPRRRWRSGGAAACRAG